MGRPAALVVASALIAGGTLAVPAAGVTPWGFAEPEFYTTGSHLKALSVDDVDSDGWSDVLATTSFANNVQADFRLWLFSGAADGSLETPATTLPAAGDQNSHYSVDTGDLDGDGYLDAAVSTHEGVHIYQQRPSDHALDLLRTLPVRRTEDAIGYPAEVAVADLGGDGLDELVVNTGAGVEVWEQQDGGLVRSDVTLPLQGSLAVGDVTGDGRADVIGMEWAYGSAVLVSAQREDGTFRQPVSYSVPGEGLSAVAVGDLDSDGRLDVAASQQEIFGGSWVTILLQQPDGTLSVDARLPSYANPHPVQVGDVTGDGRDDAVVLHGGWNQVGIYEQTDEGTLRSEHLVEIPSPSHYYAMALSLADVSGDGLNDLVIADSANGVVVVRGTGDAPEPDTSVRSGPQGLGAPSTAVFALQANRGGARYECSLDDSGFVPCTTPVTYQGLEPGSSHTFSARALTDDGTDTTSVERRFEVARLQPHLTLTTDRRRYEAGQAAHIRVAIRDSETRFVRVTLRSDDGRPAGLFEGLVPVGGLELTQTLRRTGTITVRTPTDDRHEADTATVRRVVLLHLRSRAVGAEGDGGQSSVFLPGSTPTFATAARPTRPDTCVRVEWQVRRAGEWRDSGVSRCSHADARGLRHWRLRDDAPHDVGLRMRATFAGDELHGASRGPWVRFRVRS